MEGSAADSQADRTQAVDAQIEPHSVLDRVLSYVPRMLSSHAHIIFLACLGVFLVLLPLLGVKVGSEAELIGGNYTNVTSDLGACIAAGLTVHLVRREHKRSQEVHDLLHRLHERHDLLEKSLDSTLAAAQRAESAARKAAGDMT